jgi:hypothetical protein
VAARVVLEAHELSVSAVRGESFDFEQASERLAAGELEAAFVMASYPVRALETANDAAGIRLLSLRPEAMTWIRERYPFYRPARIPAGTYPGQDRDVRTLGVDNVLVCRDDLPEDLARGLTQALLDSLPELAEVHAAARDIDPEQSPAAPLPLHPGAARFYRERELFR